MVEIQVKVEFTGVSRMLTGRSEETFKINNGTTFTDIVALLAKHYPSMLGQIIEQKGNEFIATNLFSLNGQKMIRDSEMNGKPRDGDRLILISLLAGG